MNSAEPVTVILPTLNERAHIRDCLDSLLAQDYPAISEILVVDGGSTDGTRDIVAAEGGVVRLVDNPQMTAAAAMNVGIAEMATDFVVRVDAHTLYSPDYVRRCVEVFEETGAAVVGGPMRPVGVSPFGRAVAAVTSSPLGVGPGRFHYAEERIEVETVYLGAYRPDTVTSVGGYDTEELQWAAEDQELNFRIRRSGGRIVLDPSIRSRYFPRDTPRALARQYHNYGMCKASTWRKHKTLPYWRPLAPALMVGASTLWGVGWLTRRQPMIAAIPLVGYAAGAAAVSRRLSRERGVRPIQVVVALAICHWAYGAGMWRGLGRIITRRGFDAKPRGGRR